VTDWQGQKRMLGEYSEQAGSQGLGEVPGREGWRGAHWVQRKACCLR
jgi:hypothetical protein